MQRVRTHPQRRPGLGRIGLLLAGPLADAFGVQAWFAVGLLGFFLPPVLNFESRITA